MHGVWDVANLDQTHLHLMVSGARKAEAGAEAAMICATLGAAVKPMGDAAAGDDHATPAKRGHSPPLP